jgi:putative ABC transport system permease protein
MKYDTAPGAIRLCAEALRNLKANGKRSLAIVASIACGVAALCLIGGYYEFTYWGLGQSLVHSQYGHIQLYQEGYEESRDIDPFAKPIERAEELLRILRSDPDIEIATPRALAFGTAYNARSGKSSVVEIRGVDPKAEASIFTFTTTKRGSWLTAKDSGKCQLAPTLADSIGVGMGDSLTASVVSADGQQNAAEFAVKTLAGSYSQEFDSLALSVTHEAFSELFGFSGSQEIVVLLKDGAEAESKLASLRRDLGGKGFRLSYRLWYEQAAYFRQVLSYYQGFYDVVLLLAALLAFFVSATTIGISLNERMREFGTRLSMGEGRGRVIASLSLEALFAGVAGLAAGGAISLALGLGVNLAGGIPMPAAPGLTTALRINILYSPQGAGLSALTALLVPPIALIAPARKVWRASVVQLLNKARN